MNALTNHLWQSTIFAAVLALAALALRRNSPRLRYWLWLAASAKFLIPWSLFVSIGARSVVPARAGVLPALAVLRVSTYFAPASTYPLPPAIGDASRGLAWQLEFIWFFGSLLLLIRWLVRWRAIRNAARSGRPLPEFSDRRLPVLCCSTPMEPGIFGLFRPVLLVPEQILKRLAPEQFEAILNHELCHVRYRDNLTAALHMCVEILFWFHPLIWFIGAKLIEERERHCDESVLKMGTGAEDYAQGMLAVCTACVESPLPCAAGVTGASLKTRIREIMTWRGSLPLTTIRKVMLAL